MHPVENKINRLYTAFVKSTIPKSKLFSIDILHIS